MQAIMKLSRKNNGNSSQYNRIKLGTFKKMNTCKIDLRNVGKKQKELENMEKKPLTKIYCRS